MEAMIWIVPPQFGQVSTSIWKTRLRRVAHCVAERCSAGVRASVWVGFVGLAPWRWLGRTTLVARQLSRRGGTVLCELAGDRVFLTGTAVDYLQGTINVPRST
jgi:hypothetical protein